MSVQQAPAPILCPDCNGQNPADAVFCGNAECHKALGEFRYVIEELAARSTALERLADKVTAFTGRPHFVTVHVLWFLAWVILNSGAIVAGVVFDAYPYSLLGIILAIEAILITSFVLISQNRQNAHQDQRAELDYEVNVKAYRKLGEIQAALAKVTERLEALEEKERGG
ncbi:MAG: DUF1003 domain-containing protein [Gammaproteobacteria bacterium]